MTLTDASQMRGVVERARALLLHPRSEWDVIAAEPSTVRSLFINYVVYLAAIPPICIAIGGMLFAGGIHPGPISLVVGAIIDYALSLASVYGIGLLIDFAAPYFGGTKDRIAAMKIAAYFPTAMWLAGVFALIPVLAPLQILGLYSLFILWLGAPKLMRVAEDKAAIFTLTIVAVSLVVVILIRVFASLLGGGY